MFWLKLFSALDGIFAEISDVTDFSALLSGYSLQSLQTKQGLKCS